MSNEFYNIRENINPHFWMILQQLRATVTYDTSVFRLCYTEEYAQPKNRKIRNPEVFRNCFMTVIGELRDVYLIRCG
jgi:hypothetical protein